MNLGRKELGIKPSCVRSPSFQQEQLPISDFEIIKENPSAIPFRFARKANISHLKVQNQSFFLLGRIPFVSGNSPFPIVVVFISIHPFMHNVSSKSTLALYVSPSLS